MGEDLKDYSKKLPMSEMQHKAFFGDRGVAGIFKFAMKKYGGYPENHPYPITIVKRWGNNV